MADAGTLSIDTEQAAPRTATAAFFSAIPTFDAFDAVGEPSNFVPLPGDWLVGVADVVSSTAAIEAGRYKAVNMAGASVISAVSNAVGTLDFPFLFAGDGASFAVAPAEAAVTEVALGATVAWVGRQLDLVMRGGVTTVEAIRRRGLDVRVARFAASGDAAYAMFSGGGLGWAEGELKGGRLAAPRAAPDVQPDLAGLSCRFQDIRSKHGVILSILARPAGDPADPLFRALIGAVLSAAARGPDAGRPIPVFNPAFGISPRAIVDNARIARKPGQSLLRSVAHAARDAVIASFFAATMMSVGRFSMRRYLAAVVANSDFRKYDDRLMMTLDCTTEVAGEIEHLLRQAETAGIARVGLHRQASAMVTCVVPSAMRSDHVHFIDGAAGGYTLAARGLKAPAP